MKLPKASAQHVVRQIINFQNCVKVTAFENYLKSNISDAAVGNGGRHALSMA